MNFSSLGDSLLYGFSFLGAFFVALWISLVIWTFRDIKKRSNDRFIQILAALVALFLGPPGIIVYLILRPPYTLEEAYQQTLEEEALLSAIEDRHICPGCGSTVHDDWQVCPSCHTRLGKPCAHCSRMMELPWQVCPYCATPAPGVRTEQMPSALESAFDPPLDRVD